MKSLYTPELRGNLDARMGWYVIIGTIPIAVLGLVFSHQIETIARNLWLVSCTLIVFGIILGAADRVGPRPAASTRCRCAAAWCTASGRHSR